MTMSRLRRSTVLICDDSIDNRRILRRWFERAGAEVIEATSGAEALEMVKLRPDLLILDVRLPDVNGMVVAQEIKNDPRTAGLPIIQRSSVAITDDDVVDGLELGADVYLVEPVSRDVMIATAEAILRTQDVARQLELALSSGDSGVFEWDVSSGQVRWNEQLEQLHLMRPGEFGGTIDAFRESVHPDDRARVDAELDRMLADQTDLVISFRFLRTDGSTGWIESRGRVFRNPAGEPVRVLGLAQDVSSRVQDRLQIDQLRRLASSLASIRTSAGVMHELRRELDPANVEIDLTDHTHPPDGLATLSFVAGNRRLDLRWTPTADGISRRQAIAIGELAGAAIDRALRYETERSNARALQAALLPPGPPAIDGWELDSIYVPASENDRLGGDFFDVIEVAGGMIVAVGDVAGHGVRASGQMSALRSMIRTLSILSDDDPGRIAAQARAAYRTVVGHDQPHATALLAHIDTGSGRVRIVSLGHPAPMRGGSGPAELVESGRRRPFGLPADDGDVDPPTDIVLEPGEWLVFYTDGVFERRSLDIEASAVAAAAGLGTEPTALEVIEAGEQADDLTVDDRAVVVVRRCP